jgi:hypothetical protein
MTQLKAYALTSDRETFVKGATAFRTAGDLAKEHRDRFIQAANARARRSDAEMPSGEGDDVASTVEVGRDESPSSGEFADCEDRVTRCARGSAFQVQHGAIDSDDYTTSRDVGESAQTKNQAAALEAATEPSTSSVTSFSTHGYQTVLSVTSHRTVPPGAPTSTRSITRPRVEHILARATQQRSHPHKPPHPQHQAKSS